MYMKRNQKFRERIYNSTYFFPENWENVQDILDDTHASLSVAGVYAHLRKHKFTGLAPQSKKRIVEKRIAVKQEVAAKEIVAAALNSELMEGQVLQTIRDKEPHIEALDLYIDEFAESIKKGTIKMSATNGLQAIKIKSEILKGNKDRTADLVKTLAGLAAPK